MPKQFQLPDLGEGIAEAQIIRVMVKPGDSITEDQYLMEVETDKAAVEIPSPFAGTVAEVHVSEGETVNVGDIIVTFDESGANGKSKTDAKPAAKQTGSTSAAPVAATAVAEAPPPQTEPKRTSAAAAPAVRKMAREMGIDLDSVKGTGPGGRITKDDLSKHGAKGGPSAPGDAPAPQPRPRPPAARLPGKADTDKWGPVRREPINQIRKTIANQMARAAYTAVHVTHCDEADISALERTRRELNNITNNDPKLTLMSFLIRATCLCLRKHPEFNASFDIDNGEIVYKDYVSVGIAVDTERGLVVPVIRNADQMSLREIAAQLRSIGDRVRGNQFAVDDLRGGTFTITNVGALGGTVNTPIINYPEVAILGLGRSRQMPVVRGGEITQALMLPINLSFDHRATDGANAARFTRDLISYLETPARFLLD